MRLNKTLKLKFILMFFDSAYRTRPSSTVTKYTIYPPILLVKGYSNGFGSSFATLLYGYQNLTQKCLAFYFWDRIFTRVRLYKSSFFVPSFRHQDSNSYHLLEATRKILKIWKRTSLDVYFSICKSQDRAINCRWIIQPKLLDCPSDTFFWFRNSPK